jgi:surface polysaccharide O-acyltransferase-like enzyme
VADFPREPSRDLPRDDAIDAARVFATALVVLHHTAITYGGSGGWFYKEVANGPALSSQLLTFFCAVNQAWFMGLFFLLAGYCTTPALRAKGAWPFMRGRLRRLGLPLLLFGCVIGPMTVALARTAQGSSFLDTLLALWNRGNFEKGPLWFVWALLLLALATLPFRRWLGVVRPTPSDRVLLAAGLFTGVLALALRQRWPVGMEVWGIQWGYAASYGVLYVAGLLAAPGRWLQEWPVDSVRRWRRVARWTLPVLPLAVLLGPRVFGWQGRAEGGWSVLAAVYAFWEPLLAWGIILCLLQVCRRRFAQLGVLGRQLARRAFAVFVIHPPVVVAVALAWRAVQAPALLKFVLTGAISLLLCHVLAGLALRTPGLRRVL